LEIFLALLDQLGPWLLGGYFALCLLLGAVTGYTLQALSDKTEAAPPWLAWVPLFQVHSFLRAAESSYATLFAWIGGGIGLGIAGAWLSAGGSPPTVIVLLVVAYALGLLVWFARMLWHLAERRGVSGWVGLACFIPLLGPFFFLYVALHDGLVRASRVGLAITSLLALLGTLNLHLDLREMRHLLETDGDALAGEMSADQSALLEGWLRPSDSAGEPPSDAPSLLDRLRSWMPSAPAQDPAAAAAALDAVGCGAGTRMAGDRPPHGSALWCERERDGVQHGPYVAWHPNGAVAESGRYANGQRQGTWTRFWQSGGRRAQVHFDGGQEHGVLLVWDELGRQEREIRYEHGEPAPF
jgi:hypothetical protein